MRHIAWIWLVVSSLLFATLSASADTRPQYGGTLRMTTRTALVSLDPAGTEPDSFAGRSLTLLIFDTLLSVDEAGRINPALAESWQSTRGNQRCQFRLRRGVKFHDGTPLTVEAAAASLRFANPSWNVSAEGDTLIIERDAPDPEMLSELALPRNAIAKREPDSTVSGTGPFHIVDWQRSKKLTLAANDDYWRGRPFLDGMEIEMGKSYRDQMTALELGKADLVEVAPEQTHRLSQEGRKFASSAAMELLALVFPRDTSSADEKTVREALGLSIDRTSIRNVLLQGAGQIGASLLPTWMSGYGFVFPAEADLSKARQLRNQVQSARAWTIGYDGNDPLARLMAERISLNAKDVGLSLQPTPSGTSDLRLERIPLAAADPWLALDGVFAQAGLPAAKNKGASAEELYAAEQAALATERLIPLFHLPVSYAAAPGLKNWVLHIDGSVDLADTWLESTKP